MVDFAKINATRRAQKGTTLTNGTTMVSQSKIGALPDDLIEAPPAAAVGFSRFRAGAASAASVANAPSGDAVVQSPVAAPPAEPAVPAAGPPAPPLPAPAQAPAREVAAEADAPAQAAPVPRRVSPFSVMANSVALKEQAKSVALPVDADAAPREYTQPSGAFTRFSVDPGTVAAAPTAEARRDIHAVKVVVKLVAGIAFEPGSNASPREKIDALNTRMDEMHRLANELGELVSPGHVTGWVRGQCCEAVAEMIGKRCERVGVFQDVPAAVRAVGEAIALAGMDERVAEIVDDLAHSRYKPADDRETAHARLMVSTASAVWDVFERVSAARIQGQPYSFGRSPIEITEALTSTMHAVASERAITIADVDLQVSHFQGSIRRIALLIGAEYSAHVTRLDAWINQASVGERDARLAALPSRMDDIINDSVNVATTNFISVESKAPQLLGMSQAREQQRDNEVAR